VAESFLPEVMPTYAQAIAPNGIVNVAALDVMTTKSIDRGDIWVCCIRTKAEVAATQKVGSKEVERQVGRDAQERTHMTTCALMRAEEKSVDCLRYTLAA
jgi:hypothetical protein